ncbi:MAG: outer membrane protein assembly factor BamA [Deltaproteobacteria bacterium]|nr:MAG: outer membrane protein assembly factor BamA [Deltaproteobacteria bacterium]
MRLQGELGFGVLFPQSRGRACWAGIALVVFFFLQGLCVVAWAGQKQKIAVMQFEVQGAKPTPQLDISLQIKLAERLSEMGLSVADPLVVNQYMPIGLPADQLKDKARGLGVRWLIRGTATQIGKRLSIDIRIDDLTGREKTSYLYAVADGVRKIPQALNKLAKRIKNKVRGYIQVFEVKVTGNRRIETDAILAVVKTRKGDALDYEQLDRDLRAIYKMGYFKDVQVEIEDAPVGKTVVFRVSEKPSIGRIVFNGNKHVDDDDLKKEIGFSLYSIYKPYEVKQGVNRLKDFYRQKGYYAVEIKVKVEPLSNNEVSVEFDIQENEKVYIKKIEFVGNRVFSDGKLKDLMQTKEKGIFSWFTKSGVLDEKKLEFDVQKINAFYHNHGFVKAKVGTPKIVYKKGEGLFITIEVYEGPRYKVGKVSIKGDLITKEHDLLKHVKITHEKYFNSEVVRMDTLTLTDIYRDQGYAYAEVSTSTRQDDETRTIDLTFKISKGPKVTIERINIAGNTVTRDKVIRRELGIVEGDYFNATALRSSMWRLNRLGYFENVDIQHHRGSQEDKMVMDIRVKEKATGSFSFGVGYSAVDKLTGSVQIAQQNFLGRGQTLSITARLGSVSNDFNIRFMEPWLFDKPIAGDVNTYKFMREYDDYTKDALGASLRIGFPIRWRQYLRGSVRYLLERANITDVGENAAIEIKDMMGRNVTSSITFAIRRDSRDRLWNTSRGSLNSISLEYAGGILGGDIYFNKYLARSAWFIPAWWDTVFMVQGRWGYVQEREGGKLPVYQKFKIGGINTVRGFEFEDISPKDPVTGDAIGGTKMMVYNFEYRFPLIKNMGVTGLVFFDMGNVFCDDENVTLSGIKKSMGAGIRWYSPLGPLRLEYGKVISPEDDEPSGNWDFTIGGIF